MTLFHGVIASGGKQSLRLPIIPRYAFSPYIGP